MLMSQVGDGARSHVRIDKCVSAIRRVRLPVLVGLRSGCNQVTEVRGA
jgi:hypothetical protein